MFEINQEIKLDGQIWRIVGIGTYSDEKQATFLHLASTTIFRKQRNGDCPIQMCDWVKSELLIQ